MVKLELLSPNLILIIQKLIENNNLAKYLFNDTNAPLEDPSPLNPLDLMFTKVYPTPFNPEATKDDFTQLRVYYRDVALDDNVVENVQVNFDVICARNLWLINVGGEPKIRPYEIAKEIINTFHDKSIDTIGKMRFDGFRHLYVNDRFDAIQITAGITQFTTGR